MAVVIVPILDKIWGKPLLRRQLVGACLAAFGVYALELGGQETTITDGDIMSLVQPLMVSRDKLQSVGHSRRPLCLTSLLSIAH